MDELMTLSEVQRYLKASFGTVKAMVDRGQLTEVPWGKTHPRYRRSEVEAIKRGESS